tara:strand:+ start:81 stop:317 length:237 start_codon:yes stop_codon:yes gene_type:complete
MKLNDDYIPDVGDLVQYVGTGKLASTGQMGVIVSKSRFATGYHKFRNKSWLYAIRFPCGLWHLKPQHFKVIKKYEKNT